MLSDLHIAPPGPLSSFHAGPELVGLLARLRRDHRVRTLVLAGDVFDFLALPAATATMQPAAVPGFVDATLAAIARLDWGLSLFQQLGALAGAGTEVILLPGNHDPELAHPEVAALLRARCGLAAGDAGRLRVEVASTVLRQEVGSLEVVIGHGHRGDPWNDIDPAMVLHHATTNPPLALELPLGSRLVVSAMRAFREQYRFVDALKPELAVPLLLLYLDWKLARPHLLDTGILKAKAIIAGMQRRLQPGPTLGSGADAPATHLASASDQMAAALFECLQPGEQQLAITQVEDWLGGHGPAAPGTLASHDGGKFLLRAALRLLGHNGTFFDQTTLDDADRKIVDEHLPAGAGPRVVIAGHSHAAKHVSPDASRTYINTGTWTDLIAWRPMSSDDEAKTFIDDLERERVPMMRRLTWALVDERGAKLMQEPVATR